jgi:hypothetical protein
MTDSDFSCFLLKVLDLKPESQVSRPTWRRKNSYTKTRFGKRDRNWSRVLYRRLASYPTLGGGGKISILKLVWENEIVIGAGPSTGDWLLARHLEEEERYLY